MRAPRTEPYERLSRIRLPSWVFDGEALLRPGMKDVCLRQKFTRQPLDPLPRRLIPLSAPPQRAQPEPDDAVAEGLESTDVGRHRVIVEPPADHPAHPL